MGTVAVRPTAVADAAAVAAVQVRAWQAAYAGLVPAGHLAAMSAGERASRYTGLVSALPPRSGHWVAECDGAVCGFCAAGPSRDRGAPADTGEVYALYVTPDCWGRGAGRALLRRALGFLVRCGFREVTLWVLEGNDRARRFYAAAGLRADGAVAELDLGAPVREVRYRRSLPERTMDCPPAQ